MDVQAHIQLAALLLRQTCKHSTSMSCASGCAASKRKIKVKGMVKQAEMAWKTYLCSSTGLGLV